MNTDDADELLAVADALDDVDLDPHALALAARRGSNFGLTARLRPPRPTRDPHADDEPTDDPAELARRARRRRGW